MSAGIEYVKAGVAQHSSIPLATLLGSYVTKNGWALVPIPRGQKGPQTVGWNKRENCITTLDQARGLTGNFGIAHAYCDPPTAALDVDRLDDARTYFRDIGIDLAVRQGLDAISGDRFLDRTDRASAMAGIGPLAHNRHGNL